MAVGEVAKDCTGGIEYSGDDQCTLAIRFGCPRLNV